MDVVFLRRGFVNYNFGFEFRVIIEGLEFFDEFTIL